MRSKYEHDQFRQEKDKSKTRPYVRLIKTGRDSTVGGRAGWADKRVGLQPCLSNLSSV